MCFDPSIHRAPEKQHVRACRTLIPPPPSHPPTGDRLSTNKKLPLFPTLLSRDPSFEFASYYSLPTHNKLLCATGTVVLARTVKTGRQTKHTYVPENDQNCHQSDILGHRMHAYAHILNRPAQHEKTYASIDRYRSRAHKKRASPARSKNPRHASNKR